MTLQTLAINGGTPVRKKHWPRFDKGDVDIDKQEAEAVDRVLRKKLLFRYDSRDMCDTEVGRFEQDLPWALAWSSVKSTQATSGSV